MTTVARFLEGVNFANQTQAQVEKQVVANLRQLGITQSITFEILPAFTFKGCRKPEHGVAHICIETPAISQAFQAIGTFFKGLFSGKDPDMLSIVDQYEVEKYLFNKNIAEDPARNELTIAKKQALRIDIYVSSNYTRQVEISDGSLVLKSYDFGRKIQSQFTGGLQKRVEVVKEGQALFNAYVKSIQALSDIESREASPNKQVSFHQKLQAGSELLRLAQLRLEIMGKQREWLVKLHTLLGLTWDGGRSNDDDYTSDISTRLAELSNKILKDDLNSNKLSQDDKDFLESLLTLVIN